MKAKGQTAAMQAQGGADAARRSYWRSIVTSTLMRHAVLHGIVDYGKTLTSDLPRNVSDVLVPFCDRLIDEACRSDVDTPASRQAHEQHANRELWNALKAFRTSRVPPLRDESSVLHFQD